MKLLRVFSNAVASTGVGLFVGAATFLYTLLPRKSELAFDWPEPQDEDELEELKEEMRLHAIRTRKDKLVREVHLLTVIRQVIAASEPVCSNMEFEKRRQLEEMGYFPCSKCGIAHLRIEETEDGCIPLGTYFSRELGRYIDPTHPNWKKEEYEAATGQKWADRDDDTMH